MSNNININRKVNDQFYRYKMPHIVAKVEGRGNGIKTVLVNMSDVSKSLQVPPAYPTKFIGIELGAQVILDARNDRYIVNGSHDGNKLQKSLYEFIEKYVLCPSCDNPETVIGVVQKNNKIKLTCKACGKTSIVEHHHKLNTYIIKNPPISTREAKFEPKTNGNVEHNKINGNLKESSNAEETIWLTDTSAAAVEKRMQNLSMRAAELIANPDLEKPIEERVNILKNFIKNTLINNSQNSSSIIVHESKRLDLFEETVPVICDIIFIDDKLLEHIINFKGLLSEFCKSTKSQLHLLGYIEYMASQNVELLKNSSLIKIYKTLYDLDIVVEDSYIAWDRKKSTRFLKDPTLFAEFHKAVEPFIIWLKTAEEESDGDVEVEFSKVDQECVDLNSNSRYGVPTRGSNDDDDNDDLNIDDI